MYLRDFEIDHMREKHLQLLSQINGYGLVRVGNGYELPESVLSDVMFQSIIEALKDAVDTRKKKS